MEVADHTSSLQAAIRWLLQTILPSLGKLDGWIRQAGPSGEVEGLRDEIEQVDGVVSAVNDRATRNRSVARSLAALKQLLYDTDDAVDELDCYRLQQELHAHGGPWHWHHPNEIDGPSNQLPSSSSSSRRKRRRGNMEKDAVLVCTVLGFLGSVAVTLGFVANNYSSKSAEYNGTNCVYRSPPATGLGILGVFLVFINQVIVVAYASGWCLCLCCCCPCWTKRRRLAPRPSKWNPVYSSDADLTS